MLFSSLSCFSHKLPLYFNMLTSLPPFLPLSLFLHCQYVTKNDSKITVHMYQVIYMYSSLFKNVDKLSPLFSVGGMLGQYLYNRDKRLQCLLMGSSTIIAVFPMLYLINTNNVGDAFFYFVSFVAGIIVSINGPNVRTVLQVSNFLER